MQWDSAVRMNKIYLLVRYIFINVRIILSEIIKGIYSRILFT